MKRRLALFTIPVFLLHALAHGQSRAQLNEHELTPYGRVTSTDVKAVMDRILDYVDKSTPVGIVHRVTGEPILDLKTSLKEATLLKTEYSIASHEWGLIYSAMLLAGDVTADARYTQYVSHRFEFLGSASKYFRDYQKAFPDEHHPLEHFLTPRSLDDTGSMCAAMIQAYRKGIAGELRSEIDQSIHFIMTKVQRLSDGTFARNRPLPNSVWVDDLYQGIPALAQRGKVTGDRKYYDEATRQVFLFSERLFDREKGIFRHGWVQGLEPQRAFYWARANGWAMMAITALLDVLPQNHPQHTALMELFKAYCHALANFQSGTGFWHQLMDRTDSFTETSATAMFTYVLAHGITEGWLDARAYGATALLGWSAVSTKVNAKGQVEGTSAGTSMAFDPAYYYQRPVGTGPHGYGSVLLAGASIYKLLKEHPYEGTGPVIFRK